MMFCPMLRGVTVCGGVAVGRVRIRGYELERPSQARVPVTELDAEVERLEHVVEVVRV